MKYELGTFTVTSYVLMVSDPCYDEGVWCMGKLEQVRNGTWFASAERVQTEGWGERIASLHIRHESHVLTDADTWERAPFEVGVDSGQAGFWDLPSYPQDKGDIDDPTSFYGAVCALTLSERGAGVMQGGAVSSSGYGDGGYVCSFVRGEDGKIVAAKIDFITDEQP